MSDSEEFASDNGDALVHPYKPTWGISWKRPASALTGTLSSRGTTPPGCTSMKKRKARTTLPFINELKHSLDITATPSGRKNGRPASKCSHCNNVIENIFRKWKTHAKECVGVRYAQEKTSLAATMDYGGEQHRLAVIDSYVTAYSIYKNKKAFTDGGNIKELLQNLNCVQNSSLLPKIALSRQTVAARGLRIAKALMCARRKDLRTALATSILFDEASDVTMHSLLNVFCNAMLSNGDVRAITLTLEELPAGDANSIFDALAGVLQENSVNLATMVGICSDGCSTMMGKHKGVCTQLLHFVRRQRKEMIQAMMREESRSFDSYHASYGIFAIHCVCHRFALIISNAIEDELVPRCCVNLLQNLYLYFSKSPKKKKGMRDLLAARNNSMNQTVASAPAPEGNPIEALEVVMDTLREKHKLPRHIILTRWLSCENAVHVVVVCRDTYVVYFANESEQPGATPKCQAILEGLEDNSTIAWFYCLKDVLPILTRMNCLFQSSLPLPHLLYEQVETAKQTYINMVGRGQHRKSLMPIEELTWETPFGAFANKFLAENTCGRVKSHGLSLTASEVLGLKRKWHKLIAHCIKQIDVRFPPSNMFLFCLLQVVDPSIFFGPASRAILGKKTPEDCVKELLHIFELPLCAGLFKKFDREEILNSFLIFQGSVFAGDVYHTTYKKVNGKSPAPTVIFQFYAACLEREPLHPWTFFALFLLIFPTGNAISERGFSHMGMAHTKGRSELSIEQCLAYMIIEFNGPSLQAFKNIIDVESKAFKSKWWGYVKPCNLNAE